MLDVARRFQPIGYLHRYVDLLALHKLNVLHLHLTDDQGWRMPVDAYPRLISVGSRRARSQKGPAGPDGAHFDAVPHEGHYTKAELRGLVRYAAGAGSPSYRDRDARACAGRRSPPTRSWATTRGDSWMCGPGGGVRHDPRRARGGLRLLPGRAGGGDGRLPVAVRPHRRRGVPDHRVGGAARPPGNARRPWGSRARPICTAGSWAASGAFLVERGRIPLGWVEKGAELPPEFTVMTWRDGTHARPPPAAAIR